MADMHINQPRPPDSHETPGQQEPGQAEQVRNAKWHQPDAGKIAAELNRPPQDDGGNQRPPKPENKPPSFQEVAAQLRMAEPLLESLEEVRRELPREREPERSAERERGVGEIAREQQGASMAGGQEKQQKLAGEYVHEKSLEMDKSPLRDIADEHLTRDAQEAKFQAANQARAERIIRQMEQRHSLDR